MRHTVLAMMATAFVGSIASAKPDAKETLVAADDVLSELMKNAKTSIPKALMNEAEAVVVIPHTVKAGFVVGGTIGHGVAVIKDKNGGWGDIRFIDLGGASVGFQIGVEATDVVLVFKNRKGLDRILDGKNKLKLGADASVAAGPVGRDAEVATDLKLKSEIYSYSRSRGLFAGVSLEGVILSADANKTASFEKDAGMETRKAADSLKAHISLLSAEKLPPAAVPNDLPVAPPAPAPKSSTGPIRNFFQRLRD
jgi:lipid-binding SYLF domain-containing protein